MSSHAYPITRRSLLLGASVAMTGIVLARREMPLAAVQDATPGAGLAGAGLPTLDVTVNSAAYEGLPESLAAGRYLLTLTVGEDAGELGGSIEFVQPVGVTAEEYIAALGPSPEGAATPALAPEASPESGGEAMGGPPAFFYESLFAGGISAMPGQSAQIVLDLTPGSWIGSAGGDPDQSQAPVIIEVTGEMPADLPEPASDVTITMGEYVIEVTSGELAVGSQVVRIENQGAEPHFLLLDRYLGDLAMDNDFLAAALASEMSGAAMPEGFDPETDLESVAVSLTQSPGTTTWIEVSLVAGTYGAIYFFPTAGTGVPHAMMGMHQVFEVTN